MRRFALSRVLQAIIVVIVVIVINFAILHSAPGDPAVFLAGPDSPPGYIDTLRTKLGLDKPVHEQFLLYVSNLVQGDLGYSFTYRMPVLNVILERLPASLLLMVTGYSISIVLGVLLGVYSARKPYSVMDNLIQVSSLVVYSFPEFWVGMIFTLVFALNLHIFPALGMVSIGTVGIQRIFSVLWHLILPASVLGLSHLALYSRLTRASMLEEIKKDYITTAWSKGCSERSVLFRHALRNALIPVITTIGLRMSFVFTGAVLVETVFAWPGIGRLMYNAIFQRDYNLLMSIFLIASVLVVVANFMTDIVYGVLDPRLRAK